MTDKLFSLLRLAFGYDIEAALSLVMKTEEWPVLYKLAKKQTLRGIVFAGMQTALAYNKDLCRPPKLLLMRWYGEVEQIKSRNEQLNERCAQVTRMLEEAGLECRILKGQGIAQLYPNPLLRQCGDIDVWVKADGMNAPRGINRNVHEIKRRLLRLGKGSFGKTVYHHIDWRLQDVEVEVHYRPQQLNAPFANRRFQKWCEEQWDNKEEHEGFCVPSYDFNVIYLLVHLYHHLLFEGVGLRQVCDYYVLLNSKDRMRNGQVERYIKDFGMLRFARGIMWVLGYVFHLAAEKMIVEPDEKEGRFILSEIMHGQELAGRVLDESTAAKFWRRTKYRHRFLTHYPSEILWDIPFRLYHWFWRQRFN